MADECAAGFRVKNNRIVPRGGELFDTGISSGAESQLSIFD
ncbi:hypothetical protein CPter91_0052 [Collimonas pratensis]|uniref:Uncharacterized protein n=1 Tax=Collimonas pratensis TaxID=279113 RepID=A0A127PYK0_9BURK|nr:hypothetical protein CPter91_0052 [Collimonas pratensis]